MADETPRPNTLAALEDRVDAGEVGVRGPLVMTVLLTFLALVTGLILLKLLVAAGDADAEATVLTLVNGWTLLLYVPTVAALALYVHGERSRIRDLFGYDPDRLGRDLAVGLGLGVAVFALDAAVEYGLSFVATAIWGPTFPAVQPARPSPLVVLFGLLVVPLTASVVEEVVYRGYALPRLAARTTKPVGIAVTALGFALQHVALLLYASPTYAVARGIAFLVVGVLLGWWYFRDDERLVPLVVGHAVWYFLSIGVLGAAAYVRV